MKKPIYSKSSYFVLLAIFILALHIKAGAQTAILKDKTTIIYELPSTLSRQLTLLKAGTKVHILQKKGEWAQLAYGKNFKGWMKLTGLKDNNPTKKHNATSGKRKKVDSNSANEIDVKPQGSNLSQSSKGGLSFHLGFFGGDFTYVFKFFYKSRPRTHLEGSFQYVADKVVSIYAMDANFKYLWSVNDNFVSWLNGGVGILTNVPVKSAGSKSISNMAFNYGIGIQKPLKSDTHARFDIRQYAVFSKNGLSNFLEFTAGLSIDIGK